MNNIFVKSEFDNKCRICLEDGNISIFNGVNAGFANVFDIKVNICLIGGIEIQENDLYPKHLCNQCFSALQTAVEFRKTAKDTDKKLREFSNNLNALNQVELPAEDDFDYINTEVIYSDLKRKHTELNETHSSKIFADHTENDELTDKTSDQTVNICNKNDNEDSPILCKICNRNVVTKYWKHHLAVHEKPQNLKKKCYKCNYRTHTNKALFEHIQSEHFVNNMIHNDHDYVGDKTLKYVHNDTHKDLDRLINDQLVPSVYSNFFTPTTDKNKVQCVICKKNVFKIVRKHHYAKHDPNYEYRFQCKYCKKGYRYSTTLRNHISLCKYFNKNRSSATLKYNKQYTKTEQNKIAIIKMHKKYHARKKYLEYKNYYKCIMIDNQPMAQCQLCLKNVKVSQFNDHYQWVHLYAYKNLFLCELCGKVLKSKKSYESHYASHVREFNFKCHLCPYRGCTKDLLRSHMRSHTTNYFQCDICSKKCIHKCNLIRHIRRHYQTPKYECTLCLKKYCDKEKLKCHMSTHSQVSHPCPKCGKEYNCRKYMLYHRRKVHGVDTNCGGVHHRAHCKAIQVQDT